MKAKELFFKLFTNKLIKAIIFGILALVLIAASLWIFIPNDKPKADTQYLNALLSKSSELTTAKLIITGITEYTDTGTAFLNKSNFTMVYKATVRAGINIDKVVVTADDVNKIIYITIPKAAVQEAKVDPSTIKYYDVKFSLFNFDEKEDSNKAQEFAEEEAIKEAERTGVLELADSQSVTLIKGILSNAIPDGYEIKVK